jgi:hypothetical protein
MPTAVRPPPASGSRRPEAAVRLAGLEDHESRVGVGRSQWTVGPPHAGLPTMASDDQARCRRVRATRGTRLAPVGVSALEVESLPTQRPAGSGRCGTALALPRPPTPRPTRYLRLLNSSPIPFRQHAIKRPLSRVGEPTRSTMQPRRRTWWQRACSWPGASCAPRRSGGTG